MKSKFYLKTLVLITLFAFTLSSVHSQNFTKEVDAYLNAEYPTDGPGVSFLIAKDGKAIYKKAFGMANMELNVPMKPENVFEIGSITKQFTAISILMLEEQGKLNIEDDILKYIPDYPTNGTKITIRQLLNHTSGIKSYTGMANFRALSRTDMSPKELIDVFKNEPFDFEPGTDYKYNNSGYILLGYIIEVVSKQTYADFLEQNIFKPLKMSSSRYGSKEDLILNRASGYSRSEDGYKNAAYLSMTLPYAAGSIMATTQDLMKWQNALNNHVLIKKENYKKAINGSALNDGTLINYGFGLEQGNINGSPIIQHGGGIFGFTTMGIYLPQEKIFISGLTNCDCKDIAGLTMKIAAIVIGKPFPDKKDAIKLSETDLQKWVGAYKFEADIIRFITLKDGQLFSQREGSTPLPLYPLTKSNFIFENGRESYVFSDRDGTKTANFKKDNIQYLGIETDHKQPAAKIEISLSPEVLEYYVGKYELAPGMILEITHKENQIFAQLTGQPSFELFAEKEDSFFLKVVDAQIIFYKNKGGEITKLILYQNGREMSADKIE